MQAVFSRIYQGNAWGSAESRSGPGSTLARTAFIRQRLPELVRDLGVTNLLDAPCGDFAWMSEVALPVERYVGVDVVAELIALLRRTHGSARRDFLVRDITADRLPRADLIFCRDCLVHFSFADIFRTLAAFRRSQSRYLLTTTFPGRTHNDNIATGAWRPINLECPPFCFPPPLTVVLDGCPLPDYADKSLALWRLKDCPAGRGN
jgi:hypothetical protein